MTELASRFRIDDASGIPVYLQLRDQVLQAISRGELEPGDQLPTVRELAVNLAINPNTVGHAYAELERGGILTTRRGLGTFVSEAGKTESEPAVRNKLKAIARRALGEARAFGFSARELIDSIARVAKERSA